MFLAILCPWGKHPVENKVPSFDTLADAVACCE